MKILVLVVLCCVLGCGGTTYVTEETVVVLPDAGIRAGEAAPDASAVDPPSDDSGATPADAGPDAAPSDPIDAGHAPVDAGRDACAFPPDPGPGQSCTDGDYATDGSTDGPWGKCPYSFEVCQVTSDPTACATGDVVWRCRVCDDAGDTPPPPCGAGTLQARIDEWCCAADGGLVPRGGG